MVRLFFWKRQEPDIAKHIKHIRAHFAALGFPVDEYTDAELEAGILRFTEAAASAGIPMQQAADGLSAALKHYSNPL